MNEAPGPCSASGRRALLEQLAPHLVAVIKELRPTLRNVFVMAHVQLNSRAEIATTLGISEKRVDERLTKALKLCRERLISRGIDLADISWQPDFSWIQTQLTLARWHYDAAASAAAEMRRHLQRARNVYVAAQRSFSTLDLNDQQRHSIEREQSELRALLEAAGERL